jgi:hypothetical protein
MSTGQIVFALHIFLKGGWGGWFLYTVDAQLTAVCSFAVISSAPSADMDTDHYTDISEGVFTLFFTFRRRGWDQISDSE